MVIMGMMRSVPALMSKQGSNLAVVNKNKNNNHNNNVTFGEVNNMNVLNPGRRGVKKEKEKVVVVMGATGTGKSRLSIDLATQFASEIINSDKMQVYDGLDIVTNKITAEDMRGVPHHLLGITSPYLDFGVSKFCRMASLATDSIIRRHRLPIIVGGSNSYIEALVDDDNSSFKYECCFLWVDVAMPVLHSFLSDRVDKMVATGLVEEVQTLFDPNNADYSQGIRKAIGVPELDRYLRHAASNLQPHAPENHIAIRDKLLQQAIADIKANTCNLACRQIDKILRLRNVKGWNIHRLDATEAFRNQGKQADDAWTNHVTRPSAMIVAHFLTQPNTLKPKPFRIPFNRPAATAAP